MALFSEVGLATTGAGGLTVSGLATGLCVGSTGGGGEQAERVAMATAVTAQYLIENGYRFMPACTPQFMQPKPQALTLWPMLEYHANSPPFPEALFPPARDVLCLRQRFATIPE